MADLIMMWGEMGGESFSPERIFWLLSKPHPHWVETSKGQSQAGFQEMKQVQAVRLPVIQVHSHGHMLMFGLQFAYETQRLIGNRSIGNMVKDEAGSYLGMTTASWVLPLRLEMDDVLKEFLNSARDILESTGFGKDVVIVSFNPYLEDLILGNLGRINNLSFRFMSASQ
ncbi:MAG: hypothetical protein Q9N34_02220 [Aquificota bacterium]|nr:hypothetical protein [Aquificota bacterium]